VIVPVLFALAWFWASLGGSSPVGQPLRASLPTGDRLIATPGAEFLVESATPDRRSVELQQGTVLFDVVPLAPEQRFEVSTRHLTVRVRGTVFSVEVTENETLVRVYQGEVEVRQDEAASRVPARRMWASSRAEVLPLEGGPLATDGFAAGRRRDQLARHSESEVERPEAEVSLSVQPPPSVVAAASGHEPNPQPSVPMYPELVGHSAGPTPPTGRRGKVVVPVPEPRVAADAPALVRSEVDGDRPTEAQVRRWMVEGRYQEALDAARSGSGGSWRMVEADSLRGLGRLSEAASVYDRAAAELEAGRSFQAGYLAAFIKFRNLGDLVGAIDSLDRSRADGPGSPLAERATVLRVRVLLRLGRQSEARRLAEGYLERFPEGGMQPFMRALVE
jgi:hypothetical protein